MRIIRLQVECRQDGGHLTRKYAVGLDSKHYRKVGGFVNHIKKLCQLGDHKYHLELDGFLISNGDLTKVLKDYHVYNLRLSSSPKIKTRSNDGYQLLTNPNQKKMSKINKIHKKKSVSPSSSSSQSSNSSSSSSQQQQQQRWSSSDSSSDQQIQLKKIKNPLLREKKDTPSQKKQIQEQKKPKSNINTVINNKTNKIQQNSKVKQLSSNSDSSDSDSSSSLAIINKIPNKSQVLTKQKTTLTQPNKIPPVQKETIKSKPKALKQVIMKDSSESQPSQSLSQPKKIPIKVQKINNEGQSKGESNKSKQFVSKPQMKLPPALRNKMPQKKSLEDHKQNQWLTITKQLASKWLSTGEKYICQQNNQIRFKIIQLDEQRFVPVTSGWIKGDVKSVDPSNGSVVLSKVEEEKKPYRQNYQICEHNMNQLQINRYLATPQQLACFVNSNQSSIVAENAIVHGEQPKVNNEQIKQHKNSVQKYVCGQVNYYFSDKSYNTDLFTQMHALRHPQRYLPLKFLLNFPKIKKVLRDEEKLYSYLKDDDKYNERNYEIDFQNKIIRKKGLKIEKQDQSIGGGRNKEESRKDFIE